jgi:hypothetical protein
MVSSNLEEEVAAGNYVTIRSHFTASAWLEKFKRESENQFRNQKDGINNSSPNLHRPAKSPHLGVLLQNELSK